MSTSITRKALSRALARIALAADDEKDDGATKDDTVENDDQPQGDPTKAQAPPGAPNEADTPPIDEGPSMDPNEEEAVDDEDDEMFTLEDVIECFLRANPNPTDEQVHALAELLGLDFEAFEALIFEKFGQAVRLSLDRSVSEDEDDDVEVEPEGDTEEDDDDIDGDGTEEDEGELEVDEELDVQDEIDMFVVAYVMFNPQPTDEQIHQLAFVVDLTKEEMEQRIYRMLGSYLQAEDDSEQDFDAQGVEVDTSEDGGDDDGDDEEDTADDEADVDEDDEDAGDDDAPDEGADDEETK